MNQIIDPITKKSFLITSKKGKQLLKFFINKYNEIKQQAGSSKLSLLKSMSRKSMSRKSKKKVKTDEIIQLNTNTLSILHFGCWNNNYCIQKKLDVNRLVKDNHINLFLVNGDNIYPNSIYTKNGKFKEFDEEQLRAGFDCLNKIKFEGKNISIGNHDLLDNNPMYVTDKKQIKNIQVDCPILRKQYELITQNNDHFRFPYSNQVYIMSNGQTINVIYINLDLHELYKLVFDPDTKDFDREKAYQNIHCVYNYDQHAQENNTVGDVSKEFLDNRFLKEYIKRVSDLQDLFIKIQLSEKYNHYIIVAHEPFVAEKKKKSIRINHMIDLLNNPDYSGKTIHYLCADTHLYQEGTIEFVFEDKNPLIVHQVIAGTGGTDLDKCPKGRKTTKKITDTITYTIKTCHSKHGVGIYKIDTTKDHDFGESLFVPVS